MENSTTTSSSSNTTALSSSDSFDSSPKLLNYPSFPTFMLPDSFLFSGDKSNPSRHFLDNCYFCNKRIGEGNDIFMYRGDLPFCSEECRQEQIDIDEAEEKRTISTAKRQQQMKGGNDSSNLNENFQIVVSGTVVAT